MNKPNKLTPPIVAFLSAAHVALPTLQITHLLMSYLNLSPIVLYIWHHALTRRNTPNNQHYQQLKFKSKPSTPDKLKFHGFKKLDSRSVTSEMTESVTPEMTNIYKVTVCYFTNQNNILIKKTELMMRLALLFSSFFHCINSASACW